MKMPLSVFICVILVPALTISAVLGIIVAKSGFEADKMRCKEFGGHWVKEYQGAQHCAGAKPKIVHED